MLTFFYAVDTSNRSIKNEKRAIIIHLITMETLRSRITHARPNYILAHL
jgi:hypothetical protein